jgi:hypothetical protein
MPRVCAQRLSASPSSAHQTGPGPGDARLVLNAFRRHRVLHRADVIRGPRGIEVLNAFRRHRVLHSTCGTRPRASSSAQRLSASPSSALRRPRVAARPRRRAQRLSASPSSAPDWIVVLGSSPECSTPFGVTEFCTLSISIYGITQSGCSTPFGVTEFCTVGMTVSPDHMRGAQRLSASPSSAPRASRSRTGSAAGAQRLSASPSSAPARPKPLARRPGSVLNAFRRHRVLHGVPPTAITLPKRAQRLSASPSSARGLSADGPLNTKVLNAFRRHRVLHRSSGNVPDNNHLLHLLSWTPDHQLAR